MTIVWYSINVSYFVSEQSYFYNLFKGYFGVVDGVVRQFYETINGVTYFSKNILAVGSLYNADFLFSNMKFSSNGTNITSMDVFSNPSSSLRNPNYLFFNLSVNLDGVASLKGLDSVGASISSSNVTLTIQELNSDPSCFNEGTKILALNKNLEEEYIPIENLRKGYLVKSYKHGYRKIHLIGKNSMINNPDKFNECMYKMEKTCDNGLIEDLIVTGRHSILVDHLGNYKEENDKICGSTPVIDDKYLLLSAISKDFKKIDNTNLYTYYHFVLENNGNDDERFGVWANGILTETTSKNDFTNHKYVLI